MTKIMLVEDDKSLREIYSIRLVAEGYNIVSAGDGEEALALAVQEKPDLIISDVMMPKISGFDMLDILRSTPETSKMKVIMMTALSSDDQRMRGENLGADRYLVKSQVGIEDVINTVHEVLGDKPTANANTNLNVASTVAAAAAMPQPVAPAPAPAAPAPAPIIPQDPVAAPAPQPVAPAPIPVAPAPAAPAPAPAAPAGPQPAQPNGGERVIQPISDPNSSQNRDEMRRKMDELLSAPEPAPAPIASNPEPIMAEPEIAATEPAEPVAQAPELAPEPAQMPAPQPEPTPVSVLDDIPVEQSRPTQDAAPVVEAEDPNSVQPGYMQNLATDLNKDMQEVVAEPDSMAARMGADLQDDPLTQQAQTMPIAEPEPTPEVPVDPNSGVYDTEAQ